LNISSAVISYDPMVAGGLVTNASAPAASYSVPSGYSAGLYGAGGSGGAPGKGGVSGAVLVEFVG
jgi:hypothetical protein